MIRQTGDNGSRVNKINSGIGVCVCMVRYGSAKMIVPLPFHYRGLQPNSSFTRRLSCQLNRSQDFGNVSADSRRRARRTDAGLVPVLRSAPGGSQPPGVEPLFDGGLHTLVTPADEEREAEAARAA